jgi:hypothetical protein
MSSVDKVALSFFWGSIFVEVQGVARRTLTNAECDSGQLHAYIVRVHGAHRGASDALLTARLFVSDDELKRRRLSALCKRCKRDLPDFAVNYITEPHVSLYIELNYTTSGGRTSGWFHSMSIPQGHVDNQASSSWRTDLADSWHFLFWALHEAFCRIMVAQPGLVSLLRSSTFASLSQNSMSMSMSMTHGDVDDQAFRIGYLQLLRARNRVSRSVGSLERHLGVAVKRHAAGRLVARRIEAAYCDPRTPLCRRRLKAEWSRLVADVMI